MNGGGLRAEPSGAALFRPLDRLALIGGTAALAMVVAASLWLAAMIARNVDRTTRSVHDRRLTVTVLLRLVDAESGQRGFLLTGRDLYLQTYTSAEQDLPGLLDELERAAAPFDGVRPAIARLRTAAETKLGELARTVALARAGRRGEALAIVNTDRGKRDMDEARAAAADLGHVQSTLLAADLERGRSAARALVGIDFAAFATVLLLGASVIEGARRYVATLRATQDALTAANGALSSGAERLEAAVAERTADLREANEEIQRFAYIVSHDLRAPLVNIIGFTSELEQSAATLNRFVAERLEPAGIDVPAEVRAASEEDLPEAIRFIRTSTSKMDRLINAILSLSRSGRRVLVPERIDMRALLGAIADSIRHQADQEGAEIAVGELPPIVCDRLAVEQIFSNLLDNALKYSAGDRPNQIEVTGHVKGRDAVYAVTDTGRGIAARDQQRIFDLFRRAGAQDRPGEGIGLAHVRALVRRLGGSIACSSTLDVGSTFSVTLPRVPPSRAEGTASS